MKFKNTRKEFLFQANHREDKTHRMTTNALNETFIENTGKKLKFQTPSIPIQSNQYIMTQRFEILVHE